MAHVTPIGPLHILRPNDYLEICYDRRTRTAVYVQERLIVGKRTGPNGDTSDVEDGDYDEINNNNRLKRQNFRFKEEESLPEVFRSRNSHYHASGYDRGHLAASANYSSSSQFMEDSFNLCNVAPQNQILNRTLWAWLEEWTRRVASKHANKQHLETYVTTGPLWMPTQQLNDKLFQYTSVGIGRPPSIVQVPTHFFKVIVVVNTKYNTIQQFACFAIPNQDPNVSDSSSSNSRKYLADFAVPWTDLEAVTGLEFYPMLVDPHWKKQADLMAIDQQQKRRNELGQSSSGGGSSSMLLLTAGGGEKDVAKKVAGSSLLSLFGGGGGDSGGNNNTNSNSKKKGGPYPYLRHLCDEVVCVPRSTQKQQQQRKKG